jgi:hypothetical protein
MYSKKEISLIKIMDYDKVEIPEKLNPFLRKILNWKNKVHKIRQIQLHHSVNS